MNWYTFESSACLSEDVAARYRASKGMRNALNTHFLLERAVRFGHIQSLPEKMRELLERDGEQKVRKAFLAAGRGNVDISPAKEADVPGSICDIRLVKGNRVLMWVEVRWSREGECLSAEISKH